MAMDIIAQLASKKEVEKIIKNLGCFNNSAKDLAQDIYISLMEKDPDLIQSLYDKEELNYYVTRMAKNNLNSKTSPYHTTYRQKRQESYGLIENIKE